MQLKNTATLLMIGSIVLLAYQLVKLYYTFSYGMSFFGGEYLSSALLLIDILLGVVTLSLSVSFRKGPRHSINRMTAGILLAVAAGVWTILNLINSINYIEWILYSNDKWMVLLLAAQVLHVLSGISLMLMGIALAGTNAKRQRRAYVWVIVNLGLSVLLSLGLTSYSLTQGVDEMFLLYVIFELLAQLFPAAWVILSFALLRDRNANQLEQSEIQTEEF